MMMMKAPNWLLTENYTLDNDDYDNNINNNNNNSNSNHNNRE